VIYRAKDGSESELSARRSKKHTDGIVIRLRKDGYDIPIEVTRDQAKHLVDELIAAEVSLAEGTAAQKKARTPKRREARDLAQAAGKACHCDEADLAASKVRRETCPVHGTGKEGGE